MQCGHWDLLYKLLLLQLSLLSSYSLLIVVYRLIPGLNRHLLKLLWLQLTIGYLLLYVSMSIVLKFYWRVNLTIYIFRGLIIA